jgi:NitT/TauT family transport system substrate-binding protein
VNHVLAAHGIRPAETSAVGIGVAASAVAAVESGRIDAVGLSGGDHLRLRRRNSGMRILLDGSSPEGMREVYGGAFGSGSVSAKQDWLNRNPDIARRLARALLRALQWINTHTPEEILKHLPDSSRSQDQAADLDVLRWSLPSFTADGKMPKGAPETVRHFLDATIPKVRDTKIDLAATWTDDFLPAPK